MKLPTRKTQLALSIVTAISVVSLAGCTTNETKPTAKQAIVEINDVKQAQDKNRSDKDESDQIVNQSIAVTGKLQAPQRLEELAKQKGERREMTEAKTLAMRQ